MVEMWTGDAQVQPLTEMMSYTAPLPGLGPLWIFELSVKSPFAFASNQYPLAAGPFGKAS